jgi:hypothetical protein
VAGCLIVVGVAMPFSLLAALVMTFAAPSWVIELLAGALILKSTSHGARRARRACT